MKSIDEVSKSWVKKQKYLFIRILVVILLVLFGLDGIYSTENISNVIFLNTLFLFSLPFFLEYYKGLDTYSGYTSTFRWAGLILHSILIAVCGVGYFGKMTLAYNATNYLKQVILFGFIKIDVVVFVVITGLLILLAICDFVFTFNKRELYFLNAFEEIDGLIKEKYKDYVEDLTPVSRKEHFKNQILTQVSTNTKTEGGMR